MNFLLDENFPRSAKEFLERKGHSCFDIRGTALEGKEDSELVVEAQRRDAIILTTDRDFYHTIRHQYPAHSGLVVIALKKPNRQAILDRLEWMLSQVDESAFPGRAFQLRDQTWVAQPPLIE